MAVPLQAHAVLAPAAGGHRPVRSTYREFPGGGAGIACTWEGAAGRPRDLRVLPDGCVDLAWDGARLRVAPPVAGPARYPVASASHVGIRLRPGWAAAVLGRAVAGVAPGTPLADVVASARRAEGELAAATTSGERRAALVRLVEAQLGGGPDPRVVRATQVLAAGGTSVAAVAGGLGLGERQLRRLFDHHVGLSPKAFQGVARFRRFLAAVHDRRMQGLARLAAECGYYDQAHLVRDCRRFAGVPPGALTPPVGRRRGA